jgi:hypothetical protein
MRRGEETQSETNMSKGEKRDAEASDEPQAPDEGRDATSKGERSRRSPMRWGVR